MPDAPSSTALIAINNSGAEVPNATIVKETISAGTPRRKLRFTAPRTNKSPDRRRMTNPTRDIIQTILSALITSALRRADQEFSTFSATPRIQFSLPRKP
jgi:hypothetical protein